MIDLPFNEVRADSLTDGGVQRVWFRESMRRKAIGLGTHGEVRNCRDGTVEAIASGEEGALEQILAWARNGPAMARVDPLTVEEAKGEFAGFET